MLAAGLAGGCLLAAGWLLAAGLLARPVWLPRGRTQPPWLPGGTGRLPGCLSGCLSGCLCPALALCLTICLPVCLSACLADGRPQWLLLPRRAISTEYGLRTLRSTYLHTHTHTYLTIPPQIYGEDRARAEAKKKAGERADRPSCARSVPRSHGAGIVPSMSADGHESGRHPAS